ncbi:MAG: serine/threonine-protein kinase [Streptosporangiales bacterium]
MSTDAHTVPTGRLGGYELQGRVGEGGMGVVYRATGPDGAPVAVKVLRPHIAGDAEGRDRFAREVRAMRRVRGPHVAEVLDADITASTPYVVTRYVDGPPLSQVVAEKGPLRPAEVVRLGRGLADALRAIHAAGVVHRDLKPGNVLILGGEPVVIDFGIAQVADETRLTSTGLVVGTPGYLAPEVVEGRRATAASDVHSWGATLVYAATGRPPFGRGPMEAVMYRVVRGEADLSGVPDRLRPALCAAMDLDPLRRPAAGELEALIDGVGVPMAANAGQTHVLPTEDGAVRRPPAPRREPPVYEPPPLRRHPLLALLLLLIATAAGAVVPLIALAGLFCGGVLARTVDRQGALLHRRRERRGRSASNGFLAASALPWHATRGVLFTGLTLPIALVGAGLVMFVAAFLAPPGTHVTNLHLVGAVVLGGAAVLSWLGIEGDSLRSGTRRILGAVARPRPVAAFIALALAAVVAVLAYVALQGPVSFWPLPIDHPTLGDWPHEAVRWMRQHRLF